ASLRDVWAAGESPRRGQTARHCPPRLQKIGLKCLQASAVAFASEPSVLTGWQIDVVGRSRLPPLAGPKTTRIRSNQLGEFRLIPFPFFFNILLSSDANFRNRFFRTR